MRKHKKKIIAASILLVLLALLATVPCLTHGNKRYVPEISSPKAKIKVSAPARQIKVITLNLAHGRKDSWHQLLLSSATIASNLLDIAVFLKQSQADIVALQEADGVCFWSGNFNHVQYLAENSNYRFFVQAKNVDGLGLSYGTALLSQIPLDDAIAFTFTAGWPGPAKGFLVSTMDVTLGKRIDVVSLHLDF